MKQLLSLSNDYILETKFVHDEKRDETGSSKPDWVDEHKRNANGKNVIQNVTILSNDYDNNGYQTGKCSKIWIDKKDILELAKKIQEIEGQKVIGVPGDDLPF